MIRSQQGFSLLEVMIAGVMTGGVFLVAAAGMTMLTTGNTQIARKSKVTVDKNHLAVQFAEMMRTAGVAMQFQHLPIRMTNNCSGVGESQPAVRILDNNENFICPDGDPALDGILKSDLVTIEDRVQFFRDTSGYLSHGNTTTGTAPTVYVPGAAGGEMRGLTQSRPIHLPESIVNGQYYATWPLTDETSHPFLALRNVENSDFVLEHMYCNSAGASECTPYAVTVNGATREAYRTSVPIGNPASLIGTLILVYNSKDPSIYAVESIENATQLLAGPPQILEITTRALTGTAMQIDPENRYGDLDADVSATFGFSTYETNSTWRNNQGGTGWSTQSPFFYPFPTLRPSADVADTGGGPKGAVGRMAEFYAVTFPALTDRPRFVAIPINVTSFRLERKMQLPDGCPSVVPNSNPEVCNLAEGQVVPSSCPYNCRNYQLVARTFQLNIADITIDPISTDVVLSDSIFQVQRADRSVDPHTVVFARKLGTSTLSIFTAR